jgi:glyoxylase-like metal-dependent hydrolase (beta-lactamase superfamily II)
MKHTNLTVEVFKGKEASVNSYLFSNGTTLLLMDTLRSTENATELASFIKSKALPLTTILITHGHPDHYIGMQHLKEIFPEVKIVVASAEIKQDILNFSNWMESVGWLENEPKLKPKSAENPFGFDYENQIQVLTINTITLEGGGTLELKSDYNSAEAEHLTTVFSKDLNAFFTSDFCYNGVHLWLGQGVDAAHIANWKTQLQEFKNQFENTDITIYPGHGNSATIALFDVVLQYIIDFEATIANSDTKEAATNTMKNLYPTWEQEDFLLHHSIEYHMGLKA